MSLPLPMRLDRIQRVIVAVLRDALGSDSGGPLVLFGYSQAAWETTVPDSGLVLLTIVGGPTPNIRAHARGTLLNPPDSVGILVPSADPGRYIIRLNGFSYFTDFQAGDTPSTIRDRLVAAIEADDLETATATATGPGDLDLIPDTLGGIWSLQVSPNLSAHDLITGPDSVLLTEGSHTMLVQIQSFSKGREPRNGAWAIQNRALAALQSPDYASTLQDEGGIGLWGKGVLIDLSAIAGGEWESRVSSDLTMAAKAVWVRPVDRVDSTEISVQL